jgi:hypothetical protein
MKYSENKSLTFNASTVLLPPSWGKMLNAILFASHSSSGNETQSSLKNLRSAHVARITLSVCSGVCWSLLWCEISERARQSSFLILYELWSAGN